MCSGVMFSGIDVQDQKRQDQRLDHTLRAKRLTFLTHYAPTSGNNAIIQYLAERIRRFFTKRMRYSARKRDQFCPSSTNTQLP